MYVVFTYCATETSQTRGSNSTDKGYCHHSTLRKGVQMYFSLIFYELCIFPRLSSFQLYSCVYSAIFMCLFMMQVGFEHVRMRRRRRALRLTSSLLTALPKLAPPKNKKGSSNRTDKDFDHHSTLRIGVYMNFFL